MSGEKCGFVLLSEFSRQRLVAEALRGFNAMKVIVGCNIMFIP